MGYHPHGSITTKHGFSNGSNWLIGLFLLMDMSILNKGPKHVFFYYQLDLGD
jgi:hypothetical protein